MNQNLHNLRVGDRLVRGKGVFSKHHGIYVGVHYGQHYVAENNTPHGVRYVTLVQFLNGYMLERTERFEGNEYQRGQIIPFINGKLGTNYDLLTYNCEHFANHVRTGEPKSYQVQNGVGLGLLAAAIWFGSRNS